MVLVALCYFPMAFTGYATFGNSVKDNILISIEKHAWLIIIARQASSFMLLEAIRSNFINYLFLSFRLIWTIKKRNSMLIVIVKSFSIHRNHI